MAKISAEKTIRALVKSNVETYATTFSARHIRELDNPKGTINMKIHNVFIEALGKETQYYTALVRSLDSSLGNMLERLGINIAELFYEVHRRVEGPLGVEQTKLIAELLEEYKRNVRKPSVSDYQSLRNKPAGDSSFNKRHESDYYLIDPNTKTHYLIELKIGGDLDTKKARSEKEAIMEQFLVRIIQRRMFYGQHNY